MMVLMRAALWCLALLVAGGCSSTPTVSLDAPASGRIVCFVPGVAGDKGGFDGLKSALLEQGVADLRDYSWGAPGPLFVANFQDEAVHQKAEMGLAKHLGAWLKQRSDCRIDLVGHSAGCGVILGALEELGSLKVGRVILLAPSVSPTYDLAPALARVNGRIDVFHSPHDTFFLKWRTGTFGTYDNVKTPAAGHLGFKVNPSLPADLSKKLVQHPYDAKWEELGNGGGHMGPLAEDFGKRVLLPLLQSQ